MKTVSQKCCFLMLYNYLCTLWACMASQSSITNQILAEQMLKKYSSLAGSRTADVCSASALAVRIFAPQSGDA